MTEVKRRKHTKVYTKSETVLIETPKRIIFNGKESTKILPRLRTRSVFRDLFVISGPFHKTVAYFLHVKHIPSTYLYKIQISSCNIVML